MLDTKPFGMKALKVSDGCNEADMCGIELTFSEVVETRRLKCNQRTVVTESRLDGIEFSFKSGGISWQALSIMTGRELRTDESGETVSISARTGDSYPLIIISGKATLPNKYGFNEISDVHVRLLGGRITEGFNGSFTQDEFMILEGGGVAESYEFVAHISEEEPNVKPEFELNLPDSWYDLSTICGKVFPCWEDKIDDYPLCQEIMTSQPAQINEFGRPYLQFDGVDDWLETDLYTNAVFRPFVLIMVCKVDMSPYAGSLDDRVVFTGGVGEVFAKIEMPSNTWQVQSGASVTTVGPNDDDWHVHVFRWSENSDLVEHYIDGVKVGTATTFTTDIFNQLTIGATSLGMDASPLQVSEIRLYRRDLTQQNIVVLSEDIANKWVI